MSVPRVAPPRVFPLAQGAPKPAPGAPGADAYRQAAFVLSADIEAVLQALNVEGAIASASAGARYRNQRVAAGMLTWSRSWLCRLQALHALQWGNCAAAIPLVRAAADYLAAELALVGPDAAEWEGWLESGGLGPAHGEHASEFRLHAFRSAETLARHPRLGEVYRAATDLALPHFGSTLLVAGSESTPERVLATFGDRDFHLGLAELVLGWLHLLAAEQLRAAADPGSPFGLPPDADPLAEAARLEALASASARCRIERVEHEGESRYLVVNWRRTAGATPKRILL